MMFYLHGRQLIALVTFEIILLTGNFIVMAIDIFIFINPFFHILYGEWLQFCLKLYNSFHFAVRPPNKLSPNLQNCISIQNKSIQIFP